MFKNGTKNEVLTLFPLKGFFNKRIRLKKHTNTKNRCYKKRGSRNNYFRSGKRHSTLKIKAAPFTETPLTIFHST